MDLGGRPGVPAFRSAPDCRTLPSSGPEYAGDRSDAPRSEGADGTMDRAEADAGAGAVRPDPAAQLRGVVVSVVGFTGAAHRAGSVCATRGARPGPAAGCRAPWRCGESLLPRRARSTRPSLIPQRGTASAP